MAGALMKDAGTLPNMVLLIFLSYFLKGLTYSLLSGQLHRGKEIIRHSGDDCTLTLN